MRERRKKTKEKKPAREGTEGGEERGEKITGGCFKGSRGEVEAEHSAFREISSECTMLNAPLCLQRAMGGGWGAKIMKCSPFLSSSLAYVGDFSLETVLMEVTAMIPGKLREVGLCGCVCVSGSCLYTLILNQVSLWQP